MKEEVCLSRYSIHAPTAGSDPGEAKGAEAPPPPPPSKLMRCATHILAKILASSST